MTLAGINPAYDRNDVVEIVFYVPENLVCRQDETLGKTIKHATYGTTVHTMHAKVRRL